MTTTCIRKADWVVRWNPDGKRHEYVRHADVAFRDDVLLHVAPDYPDPVDQEIDGQALMVMPGLVNIHAHPTNQPITRAILTVLRDQITPLDENRRWLAVLALVVFVLTFTPVPLTLF